MYGKIDLALYCIFVLTIMVVFMMAYFQVATRMNILDRPNERSSHRIPTIRGGGIIFVFSLSFWFVTEHFSYPWFIGSALLLAVVSFADDLHQQSPLFRSTGQFVAFLLMGAQIDLFHQPIWLILVTMIIGIGAINAFNFMDGINGITGVYSLVNLLTLFYINRTIVSFTYESILVCVILSVLVFLFFNFRRRARCFAGDVGSIVIAFVQIFLVLQLIYTSGNYGWCLLFLLYGIDSIVTIIYRIKRRENIFKAHRSHLYQYFSNEMAIPHLSVSLAYGIIQLLCNALVVYFLIDQPGWYFIVFVLVTGLSYVGVREMVLGRIGIGGLFTAIR